MHIRSPPAWGKKKGGGGRKIHPTMAVLYLHSAREEAGGRGNQELRGGALFTSVLTAQPVPVPAKPDDVVLLYDLCPSQREKATPPPTQPSPGFL